MVNVYTIFTNTHESLGRRGKKNRPNNLGLSRDITNQVSRALTSHEASSVVIDHCNYKMQFSLLHSCTMLPSWQQLHGLVCKPANTIFKELGFLPRGFLKARREKLKPDVCPWAQFLRGLWQELLSEKQGSSCLGRQEVKFGILSRHPCLNGVQLTFYWLCLVLKACLYMFGLMA